jgi:hypothetical protein
MKFGARQEHPRQTGIASLGRDWNRPGLQSPADPTAPQAHGAGLCLSSMGR